MTKKYLASILRLSLLLILIAGLVIQPQFSAEALTTLTVEPLTWNVIGLDSNNVSVGPNHFPVGARVCNTGTENATNVTADWVWPNGVPAYMALRNGTLTSINLGTLTPGACADAYFEVAVTRNSAAYDTTGSYRIDVTAGNVTGTISTPTPRQLYVEHLISQNRNAVTDVRFGTSLASLTSVAAGGTMNLMVGNTYYIQLVGATATQGYEQIESFINIPNTIFQVLGVTTTYTANAGTDPDAATKLYANGCNWEADPNSPNYRSCLSTGKYGGNITVTYQVRILQVPSSPLVNPVPLSTLIYDFSGSSYHYNADYSVSTRFANIINASIEKSFSPKTITPGSNSTLTFTINNPGATAITDVNFTDDLPNNLNLANANVSYSGCGTPSPTSGSLVDPMSFSNITVSGNSTCTITVTVTSNTNGTYNNTTSTLKLGTTDTGDTAIDSLVVSSSPAPPSSCVSRTAIATWTFENYAALAGNTITAGDAGPFDASSDLLPTTTPQAIYRLAGSSSSAIIDSDLAVPTNWTTPSAGNTTTVWGIRQSWLNAAPATPGDPSTFTSPFFEFQVNTEGLYGGLGISLDYNLVSSSGWNNSGNWYVLYSTNGTLWSLLNSGSWNKTTWYAPTDATYGITATSTSTSTNVYFRLYYIGASSSQNANANAYVDNVVITGCQLPSVPTMSKAFATNPIPVGGSSLLTFTLNNPNASTALTGVSFTDVLPGGLVINTPNGLVNNCGGTATAVAGTQTISLSGGTISAASSCTIQVSVRGSSAGSYTNTSTNISSTETGPNTSTTPNVGFGQASLTVVAPPVINKSFTANPIFTGNNTVLSFSITNPNTSTALTGVNFTDNLPTGLVVANPNGLSNACGGTATATPASSVVSLTGVTLAAGASCTVTVNVTGTTTGLKSNSVTVGSANGGTGNTATADVLVKDPAPGLTLLKQVGPTASGPWTSFLSVTAGDNVYYRFVVENTGDIALTGVDVTDPDPNVDPSTCSWVDGDGTPLVAPFNLPVANANDDQLAICVIGPVTAASGSHSNTATVDDNNPSTPSASDTSTATYATPGLTLDKTSLETSFTVAGDTLNYNYLVTNSGDVPLLGPVTVADDRATVTCPDVNTVGDNDNWLDPSEQITCTASYTVLPADATAGFVTNTATATVSSVDSNQDSVTVNQVHPDLTVTKTNDVSNSVPQNGTFNWTLTVANSGSATASFADTQVIMNDTLPGAAGYYPQGALTVTNGGTPPTGTINCSITGTALSCVASGAVTLPVNASFSITFSVTPTAAGSLANTATVDPNGNITESNEGNNTGSDTVTVVAPPSISKSFSPNPVLAGANSTLTITITNSNTATALTGVAFTDTYPAGLVNTMPASTSNTCGGTLTAANGGGSVSLSGGTIAANSNCTITTTVVAAAGGDYANTTGTVTSTNGGNGNTGSSTLHVYDASPLKSIVTTSEPSTGNVAGTERVAIGEMIRYRLATRIPEGSYTNVQLVDNLPTGLQFVDDGTAMVAFVCDSGAACMTSSTLAGVGLVVSGNSSAVTPTFVLPGSAISGGGGSGVDVTFSFGNITNSDTDSDSEYIVVEFNALVLNVNSSLQINQGVDNSPDSSGGSNGNFRINTTTLNVNGSQVGSASPNVTVSIAEPAITSIAKSVAPASGPYLPGDSLTYTLQFSNVANGNSATTAFDVVVTDTFDADLTLGAVTVTSTQGTSGVDSCAGGTSFVTSNSTVAQLVTVNVSCLDPGNSVTVTVAATIAGSTTSGTTISNSAGLTYTSLPGTQGNCAASPFTCTGVGGIGSGTGERNGSGGPGADLTVLNNYAATSNTTNTTVSGLVDISLDKQVSNSTPTVGSTVTFTLVIANGGPSTATNIDVTDVLPSGYTYVTASIIGGDTNDDTNPSTTGLTWTINTLASGASVNLTYQATVLASGSYNNYAEVTDHDQSDIDSTPGDGSNGDDDDDTVTVTPGTALIADPALAKAGDPNRASVGEEVTFMITVTNQGNAPASGVVVTDVLPAQFDVTAVNVSGAPLGTTVNVTPPIGTGSAPYTVVVTLGGDLGVTDLVVIDIVTTVNSLGNPPIVNTASLVTTSGTDVTSNNSDSVSITTQAPRTNLPDTGFAPDVVTELRNQPQELRYASTDLMLEIPRLGVRMNIVGVPATKDGWDVSWLGNQAGWLEGSAFPSWSGNSVLTGHVYNSNGLPGPFVNLSSLRYGDRVIVHAYGLKYIFEIRTNEVVAPNDASALRHEEKSWITLITCKEYDEVTDTYGKRVVVRAVLVNVTR